MTTQTDFRAGLLDADIAAPVGLKGSDDAPAGKRYDVYRNNVTVSLIDAMRTAFPLVRKLLADQNFDNLAPLYVRQHPPSSPLMMFYGDEFPAFIEGFTPLSHIGYLPDSARLDLAIRASYHAADAPALTAETLQSMDPEKLMVTGFALSPAARILRSRWPLHDIWRFNFEAGAPKPQSVAQDVLVTRPEFDPHPHLLPEGGAIWLTALDAGDPFGAAHEAALAACPTFDLGAALTLALTTGALTTKART